YHPKEFIKNIWTTIANGKVWKGELKNKAKDGTIYWVDTTIVPFLNEAGKPYQYVAIRSDITERKNAEVTLTEKALYTEKRTDELAEVLLKYTLMDFSQPIAISDAGDEWDAIAVGLHTLSEELQSYVKQVEDSNNRLETVNKELEAFSYSVSHDLRAPLRAINGYAQVLNEDYTVKLDKEGKRLIDNITHYANQMGTLIDDLLAFSKLGRTELRKRKIDTHTLVEGVLIDLEKSTSHKAKIKIGILHPVVADYALLHQVFINLISNAIKYSSKKTTPVIEISSDKKKEDVLFLIKDNGVGFDMKYANKLFGVFQRLHSHQEFEGTGVGLAIVQRIVSKHGGKVWAKSEPDKGAEFYISIPNK
ncbi:MAG: ATP-binding protein, partial [Flavobacteriales bacterium]